VFEAAVVAKKDEHALVKPKAYIVLKKDRRPSEKLAKDIQAFVKKNIAPYKFPRWIEFTKALPKTSTGKIQRYKLRGD
jgi:4-hydroxybenzoate-CoA ligase